MKHESGCIEIPCTCVIILRQKLEKVEADKASNDRDYFEQASRIYSLEKKIQDFYSCCCSGCTKHNLMYGIS